MKEFSFSAGDNLAGERLDKAVSYLTGELTRTRSQKLLAEGLVLVNKTIQKANYRVRLGDTIVVTIPPVRETSLAPQKMELDILFEDDELLVINKHKGLVVHPASGHREGTLVNALLHHCRNLSGIGGEARPGIVHRLDKDTSGVMVVAKTDRAHLSLSKQFKSHSIKREYLAIVYGNVRVDEGKIEGAIARHPRDRKKNAVVPEGKGRAAVTHFHVLERLGISTYLALRLETGRTHQIRVHLSSVGYPVVGDPLYGPKKPPLKFNGQALHARLLGFFHPVGGKYLEFTRQPPDDFNELLALLRRKEKERERT